MTERDPLPFPRLENDDDFVGKSNRSINKSFNSSGGCKELNTSGGQEEVLLIQPGEASPWERLHSNKTLSSQRHEVYHYDPVAPKDSLDFALKVEYDHHNVCMASKVESLLQPETAGVEHGRVLKNRPVTTEPVTLETKELVSKQAVPRKSTLDSTKGLAIEGHHSEGTNRGYSRKKDGGFYCT